MKVSKCDKIKKPKNKVNEWDIVTFIKVPFFKKKLLCYFHKKSFLPKKSRVSHSLKTYMVISLAPSRVLLVL